RWPIERVLAEMYSFSFGAPIPLQEMNLRTYVPRPQPTPRQWPELRSTWAEFCPRERPHDYAELVRTLRASDDPPAVRRRLAELLAADGVCALPLAARLIDSADDPAADAALDAARRGLGAAATESPRPPGPVPEEDEHFADVLSAASLVADLGAPED